MVRKLLLTSILVVVYSGSAPHLAGSLITTFIFILLHLQVHPYLNKGLNEFQRLALVTQFLTIFGGIIYLMTQCLDELHDVQPNAGDQAASELLAVFILVINWVTALLYPLYRTIIAITAACGLPSILQASVSGLSSCLCTACTASATRTTDDTVPSPGGKAAADETRGAREAAIQSAASLRRRRAAASRIEEAAATCGETSAGTSYAQVDQIPSQPVRHYQHGSSDSLDIMAASSSLVDYRLLVAEKDRRISQLEAEAREKEALLRQLQQQLAGSLDPRDGATYCLGNVPEGVSKGDSHYNHKKRDRGDGEGDSTIGSDSVSVAESFVPSSVHQSSTDVDATHLQQGTARMGEPYLQAEIGHLPLRQ